MTRQHPPHDDADGLGPWVTHECRVCSAMVSHGSYGGHPCLRCDFYWHTMHAPNMSRPDSGVHYTDPRKVERADG